MPLNVDSWPKSAISQRALQFELMVAHIKRGMGNLLRMIDSDPGTGPLTASELLHAQYQLTRSKNFLTNPNGVGHGALLDADTRIFLVSYSVKADGSPSYANAAALNNSVSAANSAFNAVTAEVSALIVVARGRGQFLDLDATTHEPLEQTFSVPDMAALRVVVVALIAELGG